MANYNDETGVRYGFISSNSLDSDLVHELMYGSQVTDHSHEEYVKELEDTLDMDTDEGQIAYDDALDIYECDEPHVSGEYEGVKYRSSWLGGALHFFIEKSPIQVGCMLCSPCVPEAGDLENVGDYGNFAYGVPESWLYKDDY